MHKLRRVNFCHALPTRLSQRTTRFLLTWLCVVCCSTVLDVFQELGIPKRVIEQIARSGMQISIRPIRFGDALASHAAWLHYVRRIPLHHWAQLLMDPGFNFQIFCDKRTWSRLWYWKRKWRSSWNFWQQQVWQMFQSHRIIVIWWRRIPTRTRCGRKSFQPFRYLIFNSHDKN